MTAGTRTSLCDSSALEISDVLIDVYGDDEQSRQKCELVGLHQYGQPNDEDFDLGPYQVWRTVNARYEVAEAFLMCSDWLRNCAYVLWDRDRVGKVGIRSLRKRL